MGRALLLSFILSGALATPTMAVGDWSEGAAITTPRSNPYNLPPDDFVKTRHQGQLHTQIYPVTVTGVLLPEAPIRSILNNQTWNPIKALFNEIFKEFAGFGSFQSLFEWVGLVPYPRATDPEIFQIALPNGQRPHYLLGYSPIEVQGTRAFTMSCAACHSDQLFGQTVLGMTKRFPRANDFFIKGQNAFQHYDSFLFGLYTGASDADMALLEKSLANLRSVGLKSPLTKGLDTSLAQVALSLNRREPNAWADKSEHYEAYPRADDFLDHHPGDSKPAVWWNLKYKNRWLSDGSVLSGNPIYTNLLWNEIGRGSDLRELSAWLEENPQVIRELTTAVFSTEAPRYEDFFPAENISRDSAERGRVVFQQACARCHGTYEKNWNRPEFAAAPWSEQIKTFQVLYPQQTQVVDVGTDPYRRNAMKSLEALNSLEISRRNGIRVLAQPGYVPPPLVGVWARWPYFHNNAIPNLCALLTPGPQRPQRYYAGAPIDKRRHFDDECNGYPLDEKTPTEWMELEQRYDTSRPGLSNLGHDQGIFMMGEKELLSEAQKKDLITFLKTL